MALPYSIPCLHQYHKWTFKICNSLWSCNSYSLYISGPFCLNHCQILTRWEKELKSSLKPDGTAIFLSMSSAVLQPSYLLFINYQSLQSCDYCYLYIRTILFAPLSNFDKMAKRIEKQFVTRQHCHIPFNVFGSATSDILTFYYL